MPRMGKTEEDWNGLKLGSLKTVQPNNFSKLIPAACNFKNNTRETFVCLGSLILSFTCNFFAYFKFHSDWGWVIGKINQNELDCRDTAPLNRVTKKKAVAICNNYPSHYVDGDLGGYPIPQYRKKNWQIPKYRVENRRNTDTAIMIVHAYLKL